jgi:hypothetical protein
MFWAMLKHIHCRLFLVLSWLQLVTALVTFQINDQRYSYPTQDPYGVRVPSYFSKGTLVMSRFDTTSPCTLKFPEANFTDPRNNLTLRGYSNATNVVMTVDLLSALYSGCSTITHVG